MPLPDSTAKTASPIWHAVLPSCVRVWVSKDACRCGHSLSSIRAARSIASRRTSLTLISQASTASSVVRQSATCKKLVSPIVCVAGFKRANRVSFSRATRFAYALANSSGIAGKVMVSIFKSYKKNIRSNAPARPWPRRERDDPRFALAKRYVLFDRTNQLGFLVVQYASAQIKQVTFGRDQVVMLV